VSMGAQLIFKAKTVLVMANGGRKAEIVAQSLLHDVDCAIPITYGQLHARRGGRVIYVLDKVAAARVVERADEIRKRGIEIQDISSQGAAVNVHELKFSRRPDTGLMG
jgi:glucosamine-6-phosphate deaminase